MNLPILLRKHYLLFVIFFLSALFRITNLDLIEFKADEGINFFLASRPLFGHGFVPGGTVSSLGITNFPLINYLLFPLLLISLDPKTISFFIALLNSVAIVAFFLIIKRYYNQTIAFISAALIATSPWAILFSRKIWAQDFIFPLFIPFFLSLHKIIIDNDNRYWFLYSLSSLLLVQIHQSILFFIIPITLMIFLKRVKINYKYLILGTIIGLIPLLHFIYYQLTSGCFDCKMFITSGQRVATQPNLLLFARPFQILHQGNFFPLLGEDIIYFAKNFPLAYSGKYIFYLEYMLVPIGAILFLRLYKKISFIIVPITLLPFIYAFLKLEPHIHYYLIISPFMFLFLGIALNHFISLENNPIKYILISLFTIIVGFSIYYNYAFYQTINDLRNIKGDYGLIFSEKEKETGKIFQKNMNDPRYKEMIIASFVPYSLSRGNIGIARMVFDSKKTEENLTILEKRLAQVPDDRRVHLELIAYYTKNIPSSETLELLKTKSEHNPGIKPVYNEVLNFYNEDHKL